MPSKYKPKQANNPRPILIFLISINFKRYYYPHSFQIISNFDLKRNRTMIRTLNI